MTEYGLFGEESADYTEEEAYEAPFYSREEAEEALATRYDPEDELHVHEVEEAEADEDEDEDEPEE